MSEVLMAHDVLVDRHPEVASRVVAFAPLDARDYALIFVVLNDLAPALLPILCDLDDPRRRLRAERREHLRHWRHVDRREITIERVSTLPESDHMHDLPFAPKQTRNDSLRPADTV